MVSAKSPKSYLAILWNIKLFSFSLTDRFLQAAHRTCVMSHVTKFRSYFLLKEPETASYKVQSVFWRIHLQDFAVQRFLVSDAAHPSRSPSAYSHASIPPICCFPRHRSSTSHSFYESHCFQSPLFHFVLFGARGSSNITVKSVFTVSADPDHCVTDNTGKQVSAQALTWVTAVTCIVGFVVYVVGVLFTCGPLIIAIWHYLAGWI